MTTRRASETFTGTLRTNDPRRFLVEAMLGAMAADGKIHESEVASLQRHLEEHEVFSGLTERHHQVLLQIARDAIAFANNPVARIPAIAKGLPSRLHKLTALSMACEVVVADTFVDDSEVAYLTALRRALRLAPDEYSEIFAAAREKRAGRDLDGRVAQLRELVPHVVELFALRSLAMGILSPEHKTYIASVLAALPDLELRDQELGRLVEKAYGRMHMALDIEVELRKVAHQIKRPADRYWTMVYLMSANTIAAPRWRSDPFLTLVARALVIDAADVDLAVSDATGFAPFIPRVS